MRTLVLLALSFLEILSNQVHFNGAIKLTKTRSDYSSRLWPVDCNSFIDRLKKKGGSYAS